MKAKMMQGYAKVKIEVGSNTGGGDTAIAGKQKIQLSKLPLKVLLEQQL